MGMEWDPEGKYSDIDRRHVAISMQENAFQDQVTLCRAMTKARANYDRAHPHNATKKIIWLTDGQSARFTIAALECAVGPGLAQVDAHNPLFESARFQVTSYQLI